MRAGWGVAATIWVLLGMAYSCPAQDAAGKPATAASSAAESSLSGLGASDDAKSPVGLDLLQRTSSLSSFETDAFGILPIDGRQWELLGLLSSTANGTTVAAGGSGDAEADVADGRNGGPEGNSAAAGLSYGGMASTQNDATLDGLSMEQGFSSRPRGYAVRGSTMGGPVSGASFGQGAVRAYRVMPETYSAEFGGAAGSVRAIASRSGESAWHGELSAMVRSSALDAANPFSIVTRYRDGAISDYLVKPEDTTVQLVGHVSVPLGKLAGKQHSATQSLRSLAMFASWEEMLRDDPAIASPATADFYALTATQTALLANRGVLAAETNAALNYLDSLTGNVPRFSTRALGFVRVDDQVSKRDHVVGTYTHNRFDLPASSGFQSGSDAVVNQGVASVGDSLVQVDAVAGHWLHRFSPLLSNVMRAQVVRDFEFDRARLPLAQEPAIAPGGYAPEIEIAPNGFTFGTPANLGRVAYPDEMRVQAVEQVEWARGRHRIMAGFDWSRIADEIASSTNSDGTFLYDDSAAGHAGGLVDWITDYTFNVNAYPNEACPSITAAVHYFCFKSYSQSFGAAETRFVMHTLAGYAQDAWRVREDMSLMVGVRYEYVLLPFPQMPNVTLDEDLSQAQLPGATSSFPEDRNNVGPRVAVAWTPRGGKWITARLGYGWFYGRLAGTTVRSALADTALPSSVLQVRIRPTTVTSCPQGGAVPGQGFGYPCSYDAMPPAAVSETGNAMVFAKSFRLPAVQRATLQLEHVFGRHGMVRAAYAMALATQLPSSVDWNIAPSTTSVTYAINGGDGHPGLRSGQTFAVPLYTERRWTQYGPVTALMSAANATYHAGTVEAEVRGWRGLEARGSFTFSRAIDYAPQISGTPQVDGQFDPFRNGYDKSLSALNYPMRFSGDVVWRVRERRGPVWVRRAADGWRVAAIGTAGSGAPYSYEISGGTYLSGGHETINGSGGATYLPTVGRNTLRLAPRGNVDLRMERGAAVRKNVRLSGFAEAFNLLNERNLTRVETRAFLPETAAAGVCPAVTEPTLVFQDSAAIACEGLTTPAFGQATSSTSGVSRERQMELGVRIEF